MVVFDTGPIGPSLNLPLFYGVPQENERSKCLFVG